MIWRNDNKIDAAKICMNAGCNMFIENEVKIIHQNMIQKYTKLVPKYQL